eukprot:CAMPEP_0119120052 /NCGR_PEP_ID=MMETSP1310-20130426/1272_1 /TAXON_ID=464262 /ORGANISM="Genus nov. species nov., Strain RCC2339" /LENGTH=215 /DNA_ID=CAMNT_0007109515 /DNA_START=103 /DNA_END=750 /DNA_ORIENTATION=+
MSLKPGVAKMSNLRHDRNLQFAIKNEAKAVLFTINPLLSHISEIKVVCNPRRNFLNMIVKQDFQDMIYKQSDGDGNHCCFFLSNKFEPFVIVIILNDREGRLTYLNSQTVELLKEAILKFKAHFQIQSEGYYYTQTAERHREAKGFNASNRSHSHDFHLKIRIATQMLVDHMKIYDVINLPEHRNTVEIFRYQFNNRKLDTYEEVMKKIDEDFIN